jgi:hypothetical protein
MGRISKQTLPAVNAGETSTTVNYLYSDLSLLERVDMSGHVVRTNYYAYDDLRRLAKKDTPEGVLAYGYNINALETIKGYRRGAVSVNGAIGGAVPDVSLGYGYDALTRLATVTNCTLAAPNVTAYRYDNVGKPGIVHVSERREARLHI